MPASSGVDGPIGQQDAWAIDGAIVSAPRAGLSWSKIEMGEWAACPLQNKTGWWRTARRRAPKALRPDAGVSLWRCSLVGVVMGLLVTGACGLGWLVGGTLGLEVMIAVSALAAVVAALPVLVAAWYRMADEASRGGDRDRRG